MGDFFTSTQIYNAEQLNKESFKAYFCEKMKENGYVCCESDESELSYVIRFADNCKWVTICSESYEQGNQISQKDSGRIAKMLNTVCVNTTVIDSDCAILDLYDDNGKKADSLVLGRADDYFGDDIPLPSEKIWKAFLTNGCSWKQFTEICSSEKVFVEESLLSLASVIGMDNDNILFSADKASDDEQTIFWDFKEVKTNDKPLKKLTLNAAFKQIFGKELEAYGFQLVKGRYPYLIRVIDSEILHVITIRNEFPTHHYDKAFSILGGIATVYRRKLDFDISYSENDWFHNTIAHFYSRQLGESFDRNVFSSLFSFNYSSKDYSTLTSAMQKAFEAAKQHMLPVFNEVNTLDKCIEFFKKYKLSCTTAMYDHNCLPSSIGENNEGLLYLLTDNEKLKERLRKIISGEKVVYNFSSERAAEIYSFFTDNSLRRKLLQVATEYKKINLEHLKSHEIDVNL